MRWQWSIAGLIGVVALAAVTFAALRSASLLWVQLTVTAALSSLLLAVLGATRPVRSAFCWGFLMFGGAYLMLSLGPWCKENVQRVLLTTRILDELWLKLPHDQADLRTLPPLRMGPGTYENDALLGPAYEWGIDGEYRRFRIIGQALASIAHGLAGGVLAAWLGRRFGRPKTEATS